MKRWALFLAGLLLACSALAAEMHLVAKDDYQLPYKEVQAAYSVDSSIVEASVSGARAVVRARRAGRTIVTVVLPSGVETVTIHVAPAPVPAIEAAKAREGGGSAEVRYDSGLRRFVSSVFSSFGEGERTTKVRIEGLHQRPRSGEGSRTVLPHASIEIESPGRSLTLLDQLVRGPRLGIDQVVVRGAHLRQGAWELHAGIASAAPFEDLLVPRSGDRVVSAAVRIPHGALNIVPALLWLPDSTGAARAVALVQVEGESGAWLYNGGLGWGGRLGASFEVQRRGDDRQVWIAAALRPAGFAAVKSARPAGEYIDANWTERVSPRTTASASASASRLDAGGTMPKAASVRADVRHQLSDRSSVTASAGAGSYESSVSSAVKRGTASIGFDYQSVGFGTSAQYRYQHVSTADRGGHGGRVSFRAGGEAWRASAFVDAQQQALTLDLLARERGDLTRALAELGITARDPEDLLRQVRDNAAALQANGITLGELRLNPLRVVAGFDASWRAASTGAPDLGVRLLAEETRSATRTQRSHIATLYAAWRISRQAEVGVDYTHWSMRRGGLDEENGGSVQLWLRIYFSRLALPWTGGAAITGRVMRDDEGTATGSPLEGVIVVLDHGRRERTDREGRFAFERPGPGAHRVEAILPDLTAAYFTSPSVASVQAGGEVTFGVAFDAARLTGTVRNDAGKPLAGVTVRIEGSTRSSVTDGEGRYRLSGPAGEVQVTVAPESLPAGYDLRGIEPQRVRLARGAPAVADFSLRAQRAVRGVVRSPGVKTLRAVGEGWEKEVPVDGEGHFLLRSVPAGPLTLQAGARGETTRQIDVPTGPAMIEGIELKP